MYLYGSLVLTVTQSFVCTVLRQLLILPVQGDDAAIVHVMHLSSRNHPYIMLRDCGHPISRLAAMSPNVKLSSSESSAPSLGVVPRLVMLCPRLGR